MGGRTSAGQRAALSHTAALATDDAARDAALRQAGVVRVRTGLQALDAARALSSQPVPRGPRVAVVTNSGGTGVELTDLLADQGLKVPGAEPAAAGPAAGAAARLRQRPQPGGHDAGLEAVHHGVPGRDRPAGPVGRGRRGGAGAVAAVGVGGSSCGGTGCGVAAACGFGAGAGLRVLGRAARRGSGRGRAACGGHPCFAWPERTAGRWASAVRCGARAMTCRAWGRRGAGRSART